MYIKNQYERLSKNVDENTIVIFTPIMNSLHFNNDLLKDEFNKEMLNLMNRVNDSVKLYNKNNFIYFDTIKMLDSFSEKELFLISDCCHFTPFGALEIAKNLNKLID